MTFAASGYLAVTTSKMLKENLFLQGKSCRNFFLPFFWLGNIKKSSFAEKFAKQTFFANSSTVKCGTKTKKQKEIVKQKLLKVSKAATIHISKNAIAKLQTFTSSKSSIETLTIETVNNWTYITLFSCVHIVFLNR